MVRVNDSSEDRGDASRKRVPLKKKTVTTGVWPCKINGCNKQFAREADLKRHQRTTKLHSMPNFACPQCDATFTRTDALRRHQKSRHNGVVIEPNDQDKDGGDGEDDGRSSNSPSRSRSRSPISKGKERASLHHQQPQQRASTSASGSSSYYRQHTAATSYVPPRPSQSILDGHYGQIGLPTSATRLSTPANWSYSQPWADGTTPPAGTGGYHPSTGHSIYSPSSHYRQSSSRSQTSATRNTSHQPDSQDPISPKGESSKGKGRDQRGTATKSPTGDWKPEFAPAPTIDPSLEALESTDPNQLTPEQAKVISLQITQAAMKAVFESAKQEAESRASSKSESCGESSTAVSSVLPSRQDSETIVDGDVKSASGEGNHEHQNEPELDGYVSRTLERPEPMEHMLTEDGEPMLNPAELLTQESLASPPPS